MKSSRKNGRNADGTFGPGNKGKPPGTRHKVTLAVEALLEGDAETITRKAIELAKAGDMTAIRLVMDRIAPPRKSATVKLDLPDVKSAADVDVAVAAVVKAVSEGHIDPEQGNSLCAILESRRRSIETVEVVEILERIKAERSGAA